MSTKSISYSLGRSSDMKGAKSFNCIFTFFSFCQPGWDIETCNTIYIYDKILEMKAFP